jgi:hypothetical protein
MVQSAFYQLLLAITAVGCSVYFLSGIDADAESNVRQKLVLGLTLYSLMLFGFLIPGFTTEQVSFSFISLPPFQVIIEAFVLAFLASGIYDVFEERS